MKIYGKYDRALEVTTEDGETTFVCDADYLPTPKGVTLTPSQVADLILELCGQWVQARQQEARFVGAAHPPEYQHPEESASADSLGEYS